MKNNKVRYVDKNLNELLGVKKKITDETVDFDLKNAKIFMMFISGFYL